MPTIDIPDKICPHCGGIRWYQRMRNGYIINSCNNKRIEATKRYEKNHPEKKTERRHKYYLNHKEKELSRSIKWQKENPEKYKPVREKANLKFRNSEKGKSYIIKRDKSYRDSITDSYIKRLAIQNSNLSYSDIPQPLIELKRKQLKLKRQINGKEKIN
jgi:hypothetical protein